MNILNKFKSALHTKYFWDFGDYRKTVFISANGRSGSTWLSEIVNAENLFRDIFEPFHNERLSLIAHWQYLQYIAPSNDDPKYLTPAQKVLSGDFKAEWADRDNKRFISSRRLIKDIRCHLHLKWLKTQFPEINMLFLLRHPFAVASSKVELGWDAHLDIFLSQSQLVENHLSKFVPIIEGASDLFEQHVIMWCIENFVPLRELDAKDVCVVFYEDLCNKRDEEIARILSYLELEQTTNYVNSSRRPSRLSKPGSAILNNQNLTATWRNKISEQQLQRGLEILEAFGFDRVYNENADPLITSDQLVQLFDNKPTNF